MRRGVQYLPGIILLLIGGIPLLTQVSFPTRFQAGVPTPASAEALQDKVERLRERVTDLEAELAAVRRNAALDLGEHMQLIRQEEGPAMLRFSGVNLQVVNRQGVALDTTGDDGTR